MLCTEIHFLKHFKKFPSNEKNDIYNYLEIDLRGDLMSTNKKKAKSTMKPEKPKGKTFKVFMMWFLALALVASMILPAILGFVS